MYQETVSLRPTGRGEEELVSTKLHSHFIFGSNGFLKKQQHEVPTGRFLLGLIDESVQFIIGERNPTKIPSKNSELLRFATDSGEGLRPFYSVMRERSQVFCTTIMSGAGMLGIGLPGRSRSCQGLMDLVRNTGFHKLKGAGSFTSSSASNGRGHANWGKRDRERFTTCHSQAFTSSAFGVLISRNFSAIRPWRKSDSPSRSAHG